VEGAQESGIAAAVLYLIVYAVASVGTFSVLAALSDEGQQLDRIESLSGLATLRPWLAAILATCMFSLAGIPPLAGFWGKLTLFTGALRVGGTSSHELGLAFTILAVVGALNAAIAAAYYLRIVAIMYFRPPVVQTLPKSRLGPLAAMSICAILLIAIGVAPGYLVTAVRSSTFGLVRGLTDSPAATMQAGNDVRVRR
jgi:NADH-quinone oxidoreductase subunit N